ncbi:MAG: ABC transporter permease [Aeromicrobium erythreum]
MSSSALTAPPTQEVDPTSPAAPPVGRARRRSLSRFTLPLLLVGIVVVFSTLPATRLSFPTSANIDAIVASNSVLAVVAIALLFPLIAGQFDLSVGANVGLAAIVAAALFQNGQSLPVGILGGLAAGALVGVVNGLVVAWLGVSSFITTLGMTTVISGLVLAYTEGQSILEGVPASLTDLSSAQFLGLPRVVLAVLLVGVLAWYVMTFTPLGRSMRAVGSNEAAARLVGIDVRRVSFLAFVVAGLLCGVAGVLMVGISSGANPQAGPGYLLPTFAAAFLGATVSRTNAFNVGGTVIAVLFVAISVSGLVLAGVQPWVEQVFQGAVLIAAVTVATLARRRTEGTAV